MHVLCPKSKRERKSRRRNQVAVHRRNQYRRHKFIPTSAFVGLAAVATCSNASLHSHRHVGTIAAPHAPLASQKTWKNGSSVNSRCCCTAASHSRSSFILWFTNCGDTLKHMHGELRGTEFSPAVPCFRTPCDWETQADAENAKT